MMTVQTELYSLEFKVFTPSYLDELRKSILASEYFGESELSSSFKTTKGFSVIFKKSSIEKVTSHFPFLQIYLQKCLNINCNAFYLNPLVLETGTLVSPHYDCSISHFCQKNTIANLVSILYIDIPQQLKGGELVLHSNDNKISIISPQSNSLLYFRGKIMHSVNKVIGNQSRISLVCEQYKLKESLLAKIPDFKIASQNIQKTYF